MYKEHIKEVARSLQELPKEEDLLDVIDLFSQHDRVVFCTMGKSAFACRKIVYTARSYGLDWHDLDVCHAFHGDAGIIKGGDLLILVSKSGETKETVEVAKYFYKWKSISITSNNESSLAKQCNYNICIPVESEASPFGYAPMVSTSLYMVVLHGLLCEAIAASNCTVDDYARNHPGGQIGELLIDDGLI